MPSDLPCVNDSTASLLADLALQTSVWLVTLVTVGGNELVKLAGLSATEVCAVQRENDDGLTAHNDYLTGSHGSRAGAGGAKQVAPARLGFLQNSRGLALFNTKKIS